VIEFTGERVIPGQVDTDLWNEHLARYEFAVPFAIGRRVLDAGCGSGYGSAALAATAAAVTGIDAASGAISYAREHYPAGNLKFAQVSCAALPFCAGTFDLVVAFEVIEHLADWPAFLSEACRVLAPGGVFIISTPNREYYADSRRKLGPNPFHVHEFDHTEFSAVLTARFPCIALYVENHSEVLAIQPVDAPAAETAQLSRAINPIDPRTAHFFLAACSTAPLPPPRPYLHLPPAANVLRERELHIEMLETDLARIRLEKHDLVDMFRAQTAELDKSNAWARELDDRLTAAQDRIAALQNELAETVTGYEEKVSTLEAENRTKTEWAQSLEDQLRAKGEELIRCVSLLHAAEKTIEERTEWAQRLDKELAEVRALLDMVRASRWVKIGNRVGLGPRIPGE